MIDRVVSLRDIDGNYFIPQITPMANVGGGNVISPLPYAGSAPYRITEDALNKSYLFNYDDVSQTVTRFNLQGKGVYNPNMYSQVRSAFADDTIDVLTPIGHWYSGNSTYSLVTGNGITVVDPKYALISGVSFDSVLLQSAARDKALPETDYTYGIFGSATSGASHEYRIGPNAFYTLVDIHITTSIPADDNPFTANYALGTKIYSGIEHFIYKNTGSSSSAVKIGENILVSKYEKVLPNNNYAFVPDYQIHDGVIVSLATNYNDIGEIASISPRYLYVDRTTSTDLYSVDSMTKVTSKIGINPPDQDNIFSNNKITSYDVSDLQILYNYELDQLETFPLYEIRFYMEDIYYKREGIAGLIYDIYLEENDEIIYALGVGPDRTTPNTEVNFGQPMTGIISKHLIFYRNTTNPRKIMIGDPKYGEFLINLMFLADNIGMYFLKGSTKVYISNPGALGDRNFFKRNSLSWIQECFNPHVWTPET